MEGYFVGNSAGTIENSQESIESLLNRFLEDLHYSRVKIDATH